VLGGVNRSPEAENRWTRVNLGTETLCISWILLAWVYVDRCSLGGYYFGCQCNHPAREPGGARWAS
jgi:hypothetical protein